MFDYALDDLLPEHMRDGMKLYIENGIAPGDFMIAVLSNDLCGAFGRADHINKHKIGDIVQWLYNEAPAGSWHSRGNVERWIVSGGLKGKETPNP